MQVRSSWSCKTCCQFRQARSRLNLPTADASSRPPEAIRRPSDSTLRSERRRRDADHTLWCEDPFGARSHRHAKGLRQPRSPGARSAQEGPVLGSSLRVPRQEGRHDEDPVLGWERTLPVPQAAAARPLRLAFAVRAGGTVTLTPAQLAMLIEGIDWRAPDRTWKPALAG